MSDFKPNLSFSLEHLRKVVLIVGFTEVPSKVFLLLFLFSDWLKSNHLKCRIEGGFLDTFSRHICRALTETIRVTNYATSLAQKMFRKPSSKLLR